MQRAQGNLAGALTSLPASLAIRRPAGQADPGNAGWQRDLSVSQDKIGHVQQAQGNLPAALTSYQASLAIKDRLAKADPGNAGWQRDLSASHNQIGDVQQAQGNLPAALTSYQASLAIRDQLAKADPRNAGWQRDLAVSHARLATIHGQRGDYAAAVAALRGALAALDGMRDHGMHLDPQAANFRTSLSEQIAALSAAQADGASALPPSVGSFAPHAPSTKPAECGETRSRGPGSCWPTTMSQPRLPCWPKHRLAPAWRMPAPSVPCASSSRGKRSTCCILECCQTAPARRQRRRPTPGSSPTPRHSHWRETQAVPAGHWSG